MLTMVDFPVGTVVRANYMHKHGLVIDLQENEDYPVRKPHETEIFVKWASGESWASFVPYPFDYLIPCSHDELTAQERSRLFEGTWVGDEFYDKQTIQKLLDIVNGFMKDN